MTDEVIQEEIKIEIKTIAALKRKRKKIQKEKEKKEEAQRTSAQQS